jgi:hypothetical protein
VDDFEDLYAGVGDDLTEIPWAGLQPHPLLLSWLEEYPAVPGQRALVIACGLGDDAEELRRRGYGQRLRPLEDGDRVVPSALP